MIAITKEELDAMQTRWDRATPGPWEHGGSTPTPGEEWVWEGTGHHSGDPDAPDTRIACCGAGDAAFIAHAREDIPRLIARVRELEAEREELNAKLATKRREDSYTWKGLALLLGLPLVCDGREMVDAARSLLDQSIKVESERDALRAMAKAATGWLHRFGDEMTEHTYQELASILEAPPRPEPQYLVADGMSEEHARIRLDATLHAEQSAILKVRLVPEHQAMIRERAERIAAIEKAKRPTCATCKQFQPEWRGSHSYVAAERRFAALPHGGCTRIRTPLAVNFDDDATVDAVLGGGNGLAWLSVLPTFSCALHEPKEG